MQSVAISRRVKAGKAGDGYRMKERTYGRIDLHLHLDGSLSLQSVRELAKMQGIAVPDEDQELQRWLQVREDCKDLNEYLEKFEFPLSLLQTREAISKAVSNLGEELKSQGLLYGEIRFAPQLHLQKGLTQEEVVEAAITGMKQSGFCSGLILCMMRGEDNQKENLETVRVAEKYLGSGVVAVDLAGAEALFKTADFTEEFALARSLFVPFTIHAGEADGPESVYQAVSFGAKRIGHGIRSVEDRELLKLLKEKEVTLELCPTSNLNTNIYENMEQYPIRVLMDAGVKVTINTDNMMVSNTNLKREFDKIAETFSMTEEELLWMEQNAVEASFADKETKKLLKNKIK